MASQRETTPTVLIVEDEPAIHEVLAEALREEGYRTLDAFNGDEAIRLAREHPVDLVLLDLAIPGLDGHSVLHELRESSTAADKPILITSGYEALLPAEDRSLVQGILAKPYSLDDLLRSVADALKRSVCVHVAQPVERMGED